MSIRASTCHSRSRKRESRFSPLSLQPLLCHFDLWEKSLVRHWGEISRSAQTAFAEKSIRCSGSAAHEGGKTLKKQVKFSNWEMGGQTLPSLRIHMELSYPTPPRAFFLARFEIALLTTEVYVF